MIICIRIIVIEFSVGQVPFASATKFVINLCISLVFLSTSTNNILNRYTNINHITFPLKTTYVNNNYVDIFKYVDMY